MYILLKLGTRKCCKMTMLRNGKAYSLATLLASEVELRAIAERLENGVTSMSHVSLNKCVTSMSEQIVQTNVSLRTLALEL